MIKIYYIEDKNGKYVSEDGTRRFTKLEGREAYTFLKTPKGKKKRFMRISSIEDNEEINIEVPSKEIKDFRKYERRNQYTVDNEKECPFTFVSLCFAECGEDEVPEEELADDGVNVEEEVLHQIELKRLQKALESLTRDEYALIYALYLQNKPMTEKEYSIKIRTTQQSVNKRKKTIFKKLRKYF